LPPDNPRELLRALDHHSQSAYSLLQQLSDDPRVILDADSQLARIARLRTRADALIDRSLRAARPFDRRLMRSLVRHTELSRLIHKALDRMLRRQLSLRIMCAYRHRGELYQEMGWSGPCVALHERWSDYLAAERWLASLRDRTFPTDPDEGLWLIDLWVAHGRRGPQ
jgi:hypothetical protein